MNGQIQGKDAFLLNNFLVLQCWVDQRVWSTEAKVEMHPIFLFFC